MSLKTAALSNEIRTLPKFNVIGKISNIKELLIKAADLNNFSSICNVCEIQAANNKLLMAEAVSFNKNLTLLMAFDSLYQANTGALL